MILIFLCSVAVGGVAFVAVVVAALALVLVKRRSPPPFDPTLKVISNPLDVSQVRRHESEHHYSEIDPVYAPLSMPTNEMAVNFINHDDVFHNS